VSPLCTQHQLAAAWHAHPHTHTHTHTSEHESQRVWQISQMRYLAHKHFSFSRSRNVLAFGRKNPAKSKSPKSQQSRVKSQKKNEKKEEESALAGKIRGKRDVGTRNAKCAKSVCNYVCNNVRYMYIFADLGQTSGRNQLINLSINFSRYLWPKAKLMRLSRFVRLCWCVSVCNKSAI